MTEDRIQILRTDEKGVDGKRIYNTDNGWEVKVVYKKKKQHTNWTTIGKNDDQNTPEHKRTKDTAT